MSTIKPARKFGQNFLRARWVAIIFAKWACKYNRLLEIGFGEGFIGSEVLKRCSPSLLVGIEIDERLANILGSFSFFNANFDGVVGDILAAPFRKRCVDAVYGSIPYNITGPLLSLLSTELRVPAMLLLQREVAQRLNARPGTKKYGRITVLVQLTYRVRLGKLVPPSAFIPRPKVYSQIVYLEPRKDMLSQYVIRKVEELTRCIFSERRKKAVKVIAKCLGEDTTKYKWLGSKRVYELSPSEIVEIIKTINM